MPLSKLGFIGAGQMATALARGVVASQLLTAQQLHFCDASQPPLDKLSAEFSGCTTTETLADVFADCDVVILSVKPQVLKTIVVSLAKLIQPSHLLISIAAGISLELLQKTLRTQRVIRVMPNTPAQVSAGVSALASTLDADGDDMQVAKSIFASVGDVVIVEDSQMDAVTGLSGSGPAFVLMLIESMIDAGVAAGLPRATATTLATQTVFGTAKMTQETKLHPAVLKDQVTSPAGTTIAGIEVLEANHFRSTIMQAVARATQRSAELRGI